MPAKITPTESPEASESQDVCLGVPGFYAMTLSHECEECVAGSTPLTRVA